MRSAVVKNENSHECYILEIDGKIKSKYEIFVEALKAGLKLKQQFPHSDIKVHDEQLPSPN